MNFMALDCTWAHTMPPEAFVAADVAGQLGLDAPALFSFWNTAFSKFDIRRIRSSSLYYVSIE